MKVSIINYLRCRFLIISVPRNDLKDLIWKSFEDFESKEIVPVISINDFFVAELFHGLNSFNNFNLILNRSYNGF